MFTDISEKEIDISGGEMPADPVAAMAGMALAGLLLSALIPKKCCCCG